jgi:hypothetical protein
LRARRFVALGTAVALLGATVAVKGAGGTDRPGAIRGPLAGIVPPRNPPKNLPPRPDFYSWCAPGTLDDTVACNAKILLAIDNARASEPIGPLHFSLQRFLRLSVVEQLFTIADMERVSRGEPPIGALTAGLDQVAAAGAAAGRDPVPTGTVIPGGSQVRAWGSNWADGTVSALGADDGWMYDDGYGSTNYDCRSPHAAGCWGHRDNVLGLWSSYLTGCTPSRSHLVMGAAQAKTTRFATSFAEIFLASCGPAPTGVVYTWARAEAAVGA